MTASRKYRPAGWPPKHCSRLQPPAVRQTQEPPPQKQLPMLVLQHRTREEPVWSERIKRSMSLKDLSSITARKGACSNVLNRTAVTLWKTHTRPPSEYRSLLLTVTGARLRRSDRVPVHRNGNKSMHSYTGDESRNERTDREKPALLWREVCHRHHHGALGHKRRERRYSPRIRDHHGSRGAKEQRNEGPLY